MWPKLMQHQGSNCCTCCGQGGNNDLPITQAKLINGHKQTYNDVSRFMSLKQPPLYIVFPCHTKSTKIKIVIKICMPHVLEEYV